jgi:hypothetical protein
VEKYQEVNVFKQDEVDRFFEYRKALIFRIILYIVVDKYGIIKDVAYLTYIWSRMKVFAWRKVWLFMK